MVLLRDDQQSGFHCLRIGRSLPESLNTMFIDPVCKVQERGALPSLARRRIVHASDVHTHGTMWLSQFPIPNSHLCI